MVVIMKYTEILTTQQVINMTNKIGAERTYRILNHKPTNFINKVLNKLI